METFSRERNSIETGFWLFLPLKYLTFERNLILLWLAVVCEKTKLAVINFMIISYLKTGACGKYYYPLLSRHT